MKITKHFINGLVDWLVKTKNSNPRGNVLLIPAALKVSPWMEKYASNRGMIIKRDLRVPKNSKFTLTAGYMMRSNFGNEITK
jgi:hypothetical protein